MDKKNKLTFRVILTVCFFFAVGISARAQEVTTVTFCDKEYNYNSDSVTLFLKVRDNNDKMVDILGGGEKQLKVIENSHAIPDSSRNIRFVITGKRIPRDVTFSVLVDLGISESGKKQICEAIETLVKSAGDSCVFLSYFGDKVGRSTLVTQNNYSACCDELINKNAPDQRCFYSALYSKLTEFTPSCPPLGNDIPIDAYNFCDYIKNQEVSDRSDKENPEKNILFFFTESTYDPLPETKFTLNVFNEFQHKKGDYSDYIVPRVYAFVYTPDTTNMDPIMENVLSFLGKYTPSNDFNTVVTGFEEAVISEMCDFAFTYQVGEKNIYTGEKVKYKALWNDELIGEGNFSIGTKEHPWPERSQTAGDWIAKYLMALLLSVLTILFYILVMKVLIPGIKSWVFKIKYYKNYKEEEGIQKIKCCYCTKEIHPGDPVVTRCKHIMHKKCWIQNGYHCAEYGQNCKEGIQDHIDRKELFSYTTLRDSYQTIAGVCAGLVSWIIFNLLGNGAFGFLARGIVKTFYHNNKNAYECETMMASFLAIGLLLAFFLSLVFRYFDGVKKKDWKSLLQITGLSLLSSFIGMGAFALGGIVLCLLYSQSDGVIQWWFSVPAYLLFSVCTSLSLTIKSSIPAKSALLGGLVSAVIGFMVLYFSDITNSRRSWMNMMLDFVIYGGGLGASIITVRMLAEKYFLVVKNGIKSGQRIPIHKWMNATGGSNTVTIGMTQRCEIQMTWEKSNKVAKEHARLYIDHAKSQAMLRPMAANVIYNSRAELPINKAVALSNNDTFTIGDTIFQYVES